MEMDIEEMFGIRPAESDRDSASEAEEEEDDERGEGNPMDEAIEVPEPGTEWCGFRRDWLTCLVVCVVIVTSLSYF